MRFAQVLVDAGRSAARLRQPGPNTAQEMHHGNPIRRWLRLRSSAIRVYRRAAHGSKLPLPRLSESQRNGLRFRDIRFRKCVQIYERRSKVSRLHGRQWQQWQPGFLCRVRFSCRGNAGRVSDVHHLCVQLGRPELSSTNDGHLHVERSALGPYGSRTAEVSERIRLKRLLFSGTRLRAPGRLTRGCSGPQAEVSPTVGDRGGLLSCAAAAEPPSR